MRRRSSDSGGLSEDISGLRRPKGLEGQALGRHAIARELPGDRGHELLGPAEEVHDVIVVEVEQVLHLTCVEIMFGAPHAIDAMTRT